MSIPRTWTLTLIINIFLKVDPVTRAFTDYKNI